MFIKLWSRLKGWLLSIDKYYAVQRDLGRLSDKQLADIGITRSDIDFYATRAYYKSKEG